MDPDRLMEELARLRERGLVEHLPFVGEEPSDPWEAAALTRRRLASAGREHAQWLQISPVGASSGRVGKLAAIFGDPPGVPGRPSPTANS